MGKLLDATGQAADASGLITRPYDKYWDGPITRAEVQRAVNQLATNDMVLMNMQDTACIVMNYIAEKLGVTRKELDDFVETKKAQLAVLREATKAAQDAQAAVSQPPKEDNPEVGSNE